MNEPTNEPIEGSLIGGDQQPSRSDLRLLETAIKDQRYDIPDKLLKAAPQMLIGLLANGSERTQLRAMSILDAMVRTNKMTNVQQHLHAHVQSGSVNEMTEANLEGLTNDEQRRRAEGRVARLDSLGKFA